MILISISTITSDKELHSINTSKEGLFTPLLSMVMVAVYVGQKTEREIRKLKRKAAVNFLQHKVKNIIARLQWFKWDHRHR